ncbi:MAG: NAD(P)H-dependent oxidoreductase, partial [Acidobacteriota bacterium]
LVLEHGFAYGSTGRALEGKIAFNVVTAGARREVYMPGGSYKYELRDFFVPFEMTVLLCRMRYLPPFALFAAGHAIDEDRLEPHAAEYERLLRAIAADRLDLDRAESRARLIDLDNLIVPEVA